jgi:hypothetical protein
MRRLVIATAVLPKGHTQTRYDGRNSRLLSVAISVNPQDDDKALASAMRTLLSTLERVDGATV